MTWKDPARKTEYYKEYNKNYRENNKEYFIEYRRKYFAGYRLIDGLWVYKDEYKAAIQEKRLNRHRAEREKNKANKEWRYKEKARQRLQKAVKSHWMRKPESCTRCSRKPQDSSDIEGHHEDYSYALDVIWLCVQCHGKRHRESKNCSMHALSAAIR